MSLSQWHFGAGRVQLWVRGTFAPWPARRRGEEAKRRRGEEAKRRRGEEAKRRRGEEAKDSQRSGLDEMLPRLKQQLVVGVLHGMQGSRLPASHPLRLVVPPGIFRRSELERCLRSTTRNHIQGSTRGCRTRDRAGRR